MWVFEVDSSFKHKTSLQRVTQVEYTVERADYSALEGYPKPAKVLLADMAGYDDLAYDTSNNMAACFAFTGRKIRDNHIAVARVYQCCRSNHRSCRSIGSRC